MKIAIDAMGGDHAPHEIVKGVIQALKADGDLSAVLVGDRNRVQAELDKNDAAGLPVEILHTDQAVTMEDSPSKVLKTKPESSLNLAIKLQKEEKVQATISAGNTGALLVASMFLQGRLEGVLRPAIPIVVPSMKGPCIMLDGGANVDCKPAHLMQFAQMGSALAQSILDIENPTVGLLSIGEEDSKGNEQVFETFELLKKSHLNFVGNVEGRTLLAGGTDVVVCDGFIGNIVLKLLESIADLLKSKTNAEKSEFDYQEYGGSPFLGVNGICIKAHGSSSARAIKNAVGVAKKAVRQKINNKILECLEDL